MSFVPIPNLPAAIALNGSELLESVQSGASVRITTAQIALLASPDADVSLAVFQTDNFTVTGTTYALTYAPIPGGFIFVFLDGILQLPGNYSITGAVLTLVGLTPGTYTNLQVTYARNSGTTVRIFTPAVQTDNFTVSGGTTFALSFPPSGTLLLVFLDGILQLPENYSVANSTITFIGLDMSIYTNLQVTYSHD